MHAGSACSKLTPSPRAARRYLFRSQRVLAAAFYRSFSNPLKAKKKALRFICAQVERAATASSPAKRVFTYLSRTPTAQTGVADPHPSSVLSDVRFQTRQGLRQYQRRHPVAERLSPRALVGSRETFQRTLCCSRKFVLPIPSFLPGQVPARDWSCRWWWEPRVGRCQGRWAAQLFDGLRP